jgi:hypothetical protein
MTTLKKLSVKQLIVTLLICAFSLSAVAENRSDTIVLHEKNATKRYYNINGKIFKNSSYYHHLFLDLGYNRLDKSNMFTGVEHESAAGFPKLRNSSSTSFSIYSMFGRDISESFSIMSGLGIDWVNYKFSEEFTIKEIDGVATQVLISSVVGNFSYMKKSKLTGAYLNVPLLFTINFHGFFVAAGVTGGLNIGSHTKVVFANGSSNKNTYKDYNIHLATFRYGYSMRAGFSCLSLFANYYVSPLFAKNEGPQVYPFAMGISLML